ncbi:yippee-like protein [Neoconidiobolus thromboides FSU 785]|nr:yippee-like protein [Neoconidiobolus thromboides FSU 785]
MNSSLILTLVDDNYIYCCNQCQTGIGKHQELISKNFQGRTGKGFLFNNVYNTNLGPKQERVLLTGLHILSDIRCKNCNNNLGWKYEYAYEKAQKYKEGKYILELNHIAINSTNNNF